MEALLNPFFWFALGVALWAGWTILRWIGSGGRLPLRGRRGSASGFGGAGLFAQAFYQPSAGRAVETILEESVRREEDEDGDPPEPGVETPV